MIGRLTLIRNFSFIFFFIFLSAQILSAQKKFVFEQSKMGSPFTVTIFSIDSAKAADAAALAFHCADSLNQIFSDYIDSSELNRLNATSGQGRYVPVSAAMFDILQYSLEAAKKSDGDFDITMGPVIKLWRKARKEKKLPGSSLLKNTLNKVGYKYIHLDSVHQSAWLEKPGMQLDLGGIGKGYVAQAALNLIGAIGLHSVMVSAGGSIVVGDAPPGRDGWRIGVTLPEEKEKIMSRLLLLKNTSVATSGDVYQHLDINGKRYSHIIDPATGLGLTTQRTVTIITKNGAVSDWLSTACSVLSIDKAFALIRQFKDAAILITEIKDGQFVQKSSDNFNNYFKN